MSGSLSHIIGHDGRLTFDLIDNSLKDCGMTIRECYNLIVELSGGNMRKVSEACNKLGYVDPYRIDRLDDETMPADMMISLP